MVPYPSFPLIRVLYPSPPWGAGLLFHWGSGSWLVMYANPFSNHFAHLLRCLFASPLRLRRGGGCGSLHFKLVHFNPMFFVVFDPSTLTAPSGVAGGVAKRGGGYKPLAVCPPHCLSTPQKKGVPAGFLQKFIKPYNTMFRPDSLFTP